VEVLPAKDHSARVEMTLRYHPTGKPVVLTERRLLMITAPDDGGRYRIDWQGTFAACDEDVILNRTPIPGQKGGVGHGGYAGLSVRLARSTSDWQVVDSEGRWGLNPHGKAARWLDFSGTSANGERAGIAMFDHPDNVRHPTPWFVIMNPAVPFGYVSPAFLYEKPYALQAGKTLTLRYRILVHPGSPDTNRLQAEWQRWSTK
jgi:hypothetical protein